MKYFGLEIREPFRFSTIWGSESHAWASGKSNGLRYENDADDYPTGLYTMAWLCCAEVVMHGYTRQDEDSSDKNVYIETKLNVKRNKYWSSSTSEATGFIDIAGIYLMPANRPAIGSDGRMEPSRTWKHPITSSDRTASPYYQHNQDASLLMLERDLGVSHYSALAGCMGDNGTLKGEVFAGSNKSSWATHAGTNIAPYTFENTITFTQSDYSDDGALKLSNVQVPFYIGQRWIGGAGDDNVYSAIVKLFDFDFTGDSPFRYVPWAARRNGAWRSCNENNTLNVHENGNWNKVIYNSSVNPNVPGDSNGFRVQNKKWAVSPITPS